jgi:hypothetical protein
VFRHAAGEVDDAMWQRGRGWALVFALAVLASSADNRVMHRIGSATLDAVMRG